MFMHLLWREVLFCTMCTPSIHVPLWYVSCDDIHCKILEHCVILINMGLKKTMNILKIIDTKVNSKSYIEKSNRVE